MIRKYYPYLTGFFVFVIYLTTIAPSAIQIDSGELAAVQALPGIAHPTGYPLFTMLGWLFLQIPLPFSDIFMSNLLASLWCAIGVILFVKSASLLLSNIEIIKTEKKGKKKSEIKERPSEINIILASVTAGLILAFSKTFWLQSVSVEVYSLHILTINIVILLLIKVWFGEGTYKNWLYVAAALALSFSNHMTTLLILPGIAYIFFRKEKFGKPAFMKLGSMLALFFPLLGVIYSYLPLRASASPLLNWGNAINFENFWRHFTGKQYQVWLFSSTDSAKKQLAYFFENLPGEFVYAGLIIAIIGIIFALNNHKKVFWFLGITLVATVAYSINYDIVDIDSYFLLAFISLSFFAGYGVLFLLRYFRNTLPSWGIYLIPVILFVIPLAGNYAEADYSDFYIIEDYTRELLQSTEKESIVLSYQWDYFLAASYYYQYVENLRRDVTVIDKELIRRSWYFTQMETISPGIFKGQEETVNNFLRALQPFERGGQFNSQLLERLYQSLMTGLISNNSERDFYIGPELFDNEMKRGEFSPPEGYILVPHLFLYKLVKTKEYVPCPDPDFNLRFPEKGNYYSDFIKKLASAVLINRAFYEMQYNKPERAKIYLKKVIEQYKGVRIPQQLRGLLN